MQVNFTRTYHQPYIAVGYSPLLYTLANNEELLREETPEQINTGQMGGVRETVTLQGLDPLLIGMFLPQNKEGGIVMY